VNKNHVKDGEELPIQKHDLVDISVVLTNLHGKKTTFSHFYILLKGSQLFV